MKIGKIMRFLENPVKGAEEELMQKPLGNWMEANKRKTIEAREARKNDPKKGKSCGCIVLIILGIILLLCSL